MPFIIKYLESAKGKYFQAIPKDKREIIKKKNIEERLTISPESFGKPLRGSLKNHHRLRVGDYRIIYRINVVADIVIIIAIGHRKDIYDDYR